MVLAMGVEEVGLGTPYQTQKCFFAKARPEWLLRYFSNATALDRRWKATAVSIRHGLNFDV